MEIAFNRKPRVAVIVFVLGLLAGSSFAAALDLDAPTRSRLSAGAESLDALHTLLVLHDGDVVFENAYRGSAPTAPANLKSLSKTILSVLAGIAIDNGVVESVDQPLVDLLGARVPDDATEGVDRITLGDALSLRTGLQSTSGRNYGRWVQSDNWVAHVLTRPMVDEPGGRMIYSTGSTHLAAAALVEASGETLLTLAATGWVNRWTSGSRTGCAIPRASTSAAMKCTCRRAALRASASCTGSAAKSTAGA